MARGWTPAKWVSIDRVSPTAIAGAITIWEEVRHTRYGISQHKIAEVVNYSDATSRANAKLISAAPELFESLISILDQACVNGCPEYTNSRTGAIIKKHTKACAAAHRAIAKALGKEA